MTIQDIVDYVRSLGGVLVLAPQPGDGSPEIAHGDVFFYYAPDGVVPKSQPFATVVTKNYPDDERSRLDRPGTFRLNIGAGTADFERHVGFGPKNPAAYTADPSTADVIVAHPVYGRQGWLAIVDPGPRTTAAAQKLLSDAHSRARRRYERRSSSACS